MGIHGAGRTFPADGNDGEVVIVSTDASVSDLVFAEGNDVAYTPTTSGDWGSSVPTTIGEALDTLAASVTIA